MAGRGNLVSVTSKTAHTLQLQPRDLALLTDLYESRVMTLSQAAILHFAGRYEATRKRVARLKAAGLLTVRSRPVGEASCVFFTRRAYRLLREGGHLAAYPPLRGASLEKRSRVSDLTLRHELAVMDVKCAMVKAVRERPGLSVAECSTWPRLSQFRADRHRPGPGEAPTVLVKPDGFLKLVEADGEGGGGGSSELYFYLEVDRSTETVETVVNRQHGYRDHQRRGGLPARYGRPRSEAEAWPFRVLWVFRTAERRNNVAEALCRGFPPILGRAWLSTFEEATRDPLGAIWMRPQDYLSAVDGTPWDVRDRPTASVYKRESGRDRRVAEAATLHPLV